MIIGLFHQGSGLGNQLFRYIATRVVALDKGHSFGMVNSHLFKGQKLFNLDYGHCVFSDVLYPQGESLKPEMENVFNEKRTNHENGDDIREYDERINEVLDNTVIDGEFQDERYFKHRRKEIDEWLRTPFLELPSNHCVINFRGGEYKYVPQLFLGQNYWDKAIENMKKISPNMTFEVVTDDPEEAQRFFKDIPISHQMERDWRVIRHARYLILSNSSFAIIPAWLNQGAIIIAPKYWGRHNTSDGYWSLPQNRYKGWYYQDRDGNIELCT